MHMNSSMNFDIRISSYNFNPAALKDALKELGLI